MWALLLKNPIRSAQIIGLFAVAVFIGLLVWRVSYLQDKTEKQAATIAGYASTVKALQEADALKDAIALEDSRDTRKNEQDKAKVKSEVKDAAKSQDRPCSPMLCDTIRGLLNSVSPEGAAP